MLFKNSLMDLAMSLRNASISKSSTAKEPVQHLLSLKANRWLKMLSRPCRRRRSKGDTLSCSTRKTNSCKKSANCESAQETVGEVYVYFLGGFVDVAICCTLGPVEIYY